MTLPEHPILFSGEMVRAILDGRKTQTRRVILPQPYDAARGMIWRGGSKLRLAGYGADYVHTDRNAMEKAMREVCPYGKKGHRLWVREAWRIYSADEGTQSVQYRADVPGGSDWKPSIHMPRWASRINLEITDVRVERVQEIGGRDAVEEGIDLKKHECGCEVCSPSTKLCPATTSSLVMEYASLWDSLNGKNGHAWALNPYVYVIVFQKV